jgi:hypothetical protein
VFQVHHIVPVHTLTWENLYLIWDPANLIVVCHKNGGCHSKQDHKLKRPVDLVEQVKKSKRYKTLTSMMGWML